jgi:hypothetical protein
LLQCAQGLRDEIVDDLLQELKPVPARGKMMRHFTRAHPPGPPIICTIDGYSPPFTASRFAFQLSHIVDELGSVEAVA